MPKIADSPEVRRVPFVSREEQQKRLAAIESLLVHGLSVDVIRKQMQESGFPGISRSAVVNGIARVRERWEAEERENRPQFKRMAMKRLSRHIIDAKAKGNFASVAQFERLLAEMQGTLVPTEHYIHVSGRETEALTAVLGSMTPEKRAELLERGRASLLLGPAPIDVTAEEASEPLVAAEKDERR